MEDFFFLTPEQLTTPYSYFSMTLDNMPFPKGDLDALVYWLMDRNMSMILADPWYSTWFFEKRWEQLCQWLHLYLKPSQLHGHIWILPHNPNLLAEARLSCPGGTTATGLTEVGLEAMHQAAEAMRYSLAVLQHPYHYAAIHLVKMRWFSHILAHHLPVATFTLRELQHMVENFHLYHNALQLHNGLAPSPQDTYDFGPTLSLTHLRYALITLEVDRRIRTGEPLMYHMVTLPDGTVKAIPHLDYLGPGFASKLAEHLPELIPSTIFASREFAPMNNVIWGIWIHPMTQCLWEIWDV